MEKKLNFSAFLWKQIYFRWKLTEKKTKNMFCRITPFFLAFSIKPRCCAAVVGFSLHISFTSHPQGRWRLLVNLQLSLLGFRGPCWV